MGNGPVARPVCALGQHVGLLGYGDPVCYAHPNAVHNARCPEARRRARWRAGERLVLQGVSTMAILAIGLAVLLSVWARTCGLGASC